MAANYLIVKCEELSDQWECDADRTPITMTDNYRKWSEENNPDYAFEVWELVNNDFICVKDYDEPSGMILIKYAHDGVEVLEHYPNLNKNSPIPERVKKLIAKAIWKNDELKICGYIDFNCEGSGEAYRYCRK